MLRIVHAADIHLDTPYRRHDEAVRARLREAGREAFTRLIDLALERQADALLIAGDLFDNELLTLATERVLVDELTRATGAGLTVVYATGNHDPGAGELPGHGHRLAGGALSSGRVAPAAPDRHRARGRGGGLGGGGRTPDSA